MKRFLLKATLFIGVAFLFSSTAKAQVTLVFNGVTANTDSTTMTPAPLNSTGGIFGCGTSCDFRTYSTSGSVATVTAYCRVDSTGTESWYACAQVSNPSSTGNYISLAGSRQYKFAVENYSSGTIYVKYFNSSR